MHFLTQIQVQCVMHSDMGFWSLQGAFGSYFGGFGDSLGGSWGLVGPLGRHLSALWALMGTSWGPLGDPWGPLGDLRGHLGAPWTRFGDPLWPLTSAFGYFRCLLGILWGQLGAPRDSHRFPKGVQEASWGLLGSFWRLWKCLPSNSMQYAKTFKFTVMYCKIRCTGRLNSLKINCNFNKILERLLKIVT